MTVWPSVWVGPQAGLKQPFINLMRNEVDEELPGHAHGGFRTCCVADIAEKKNISVAIGYPHAARQNWLYGCCYSDLRVAIPCQVSPDMQILYCQSDAVQNVKDALEERVLTLECRRWQCDGWKLHCASSSSLELC